MAALDAREWRDLTLLSKQDVAPRTAVYRFALPAPDAVLGLPVGQHVSVQAPVDGRMVMRSYTPISSDADRGIVDLLVKAYPSGRVSKHIGALPVGATLAFRGPRGQMRYQRGYAQHMGMVAGGTGITPCLQIIRAALADPADTTRITLLYGNVHEADMLMRTELDALAAQHPAQLQVVYFLDAPPAGWAAGHTGSPAAAAPALLAAYLPPAADAGSKLLLCGPPPMLDALKPRLTDLGYAPPSIISKMHDQVFCF